MIQPVSWFEARADQMVQQTMRLVKIESPSEDIDALRAFASELTEMARTVVGTSAEEIEVDGRPHLLWRFGGATRVLVLGHFDTVWPLGTSATLRPELRGGQLRGPGSFDMKAGIVLALHAIAALERRDGVTLLLTSDEEIGSATSRELLENEARGADAVLVVEPSAPGGALKTGRKGVASYRAHLRGRAAHAGLEPHKGINAVVEAAHEVLAAATTADPDPQTTVTPTIVRGGTLVNVVPDTATVEIDVRASSVSEMNRVDSLLRDRVPTTDCTREVERLSWRPPFEASRSAHLFEVSRSVATDLGISVPEGIVVGGGSDGNFTAALGVATLDGLGAVGDGAHAQHEHVVVDALAPRAALVSGLIARLLSE